MNESLQEQLDRLAIELKERRRYYRNSLRNMIYFCIIISFFFVLYSVLISYKIRELAAPSNIAQLISGELRGQFAEEMRRNQADFRRAAKDMSQSVLLALPISIHAGAEILKDSMSRDAHAAALDIAENLTEPHRKQIDRILSGSGNVPQQQDLPDTDMDSAIRNSRTLMFPVPLHWGGRLWEIRQKNGRGLTRQDLCDRDFMLCWLYLHENERYRDGRYAGLMEFSSWIVRSWSEAMSRSGDFTEAQKKTKNSPVKKTAPAMQ